MTEPLDLEEGKRLARAVRRIDSDGLGNAEGLTAVSAYIRWLTSSADALLEAAARLRALEQRHTKDPALCPFCDWDEEALAALSPAAPEEQSHE